MVSFNSKKICAQPTVSEILKSAREKQGLSLKKAADDLGFSPRFLKALEEGNFNFLPGEIYIKNFIKRYAGYLQMNDEELLKKYLESQKLFYKRQEPSDKKAFSQKLLCSLIFLRQGFVGLVVICLIFYLSYEITGIFKSPPLYIESPEEGLITIDPNIEVKGKTLPEIKVQINGVEVISNEEGEFQEKMGLNSGSNKILVTAVKKHGQATSLLRNVIYKNKKEELSLNQK